MSVGAAAERIIGVGVDLVETDRMRKVIEQWGGTFEERVFSDDERDYCGRQAAPWRHYAARFAVKEAVGKAFGTGVGTALKWREMEVVRCPETGAPSVQLLGGAAEHAKALGVCRVLVSLSHTHTAAVAQAVVIAEGSSA